MSASSSCVILVPWCYVAPATVRPAVHYLDYRSILVIFDLKKCIQESVDNRADVQTGFMLYVESGFMHFCVTQRVKRFDFRCCCIT